MPAAAKFGEFFVGKMLHKFGKFGVLAEKLFANVAARRYDVFLILAVNHLAHPPDEQAAFIFLQQLVPIVAPDDFDHIPAGAAENGFQFLNNLAVAATRAVESPSPMKHQTFCCRVSLMPRSSRYLLNRA